MMAALQTMDKDFEEWMRQMLLDNTRVEVSQMILPQANKKHAKMKKAPMAKGMAKKTLHKFIQAFFGFRLWGMGRRGVSGWWGLKIEAGSPTPTTPSGALFCPLKSKENLKKTVRRFGGWLGAR